MITKSIHDLPFLAQGKSLLVGITAYWNMNQAAFSTRTDSTPNGLDLSDHNSNLNNQVGLIGNAVVTSQSNASNGLVHAANALFNVGVGTSVSFSMWMLGGGAPINDHGIVSYDDGTHQAYDLYYSSVATAFQWLVVEATTLTQKTINMVTGAAFAAGGSVWHHFAFGYDDTAKQIWAQYDNGTRSTVACNGINPVTIPSFVIGNFSNLASPQDVIIDEVGYWRRALTTAEVAHLFNSGAGITYPF